MRLSRIFSFLSFLGLAFLLFFFLQRRDKTLPKVLRIYNWEAYIPKRVIRQFEKQEGVIVHYDAFENLETLEAKLLAARSGYDIVFPPAWPTVKLFLPAGAFSKLDLRKIPNARFISSEMQTRLKQVDPQGSYILPYLWGTTGIIINITRVTAHVPEAPLNSWAILFDPTWARKLAPLGLVLLDSPADVFPDVHLFLGIPIGNKTEETLTRVTDQLMKVRPYIYKFSSAPLIQDLISETIAVAEIFSSYATMAIQKARKMKLKSNLIFIIPKEGALMWIDTMAIPKDAANKDLAHRFINFILNPKIMAEITNKTGAANAIPASQKWLKPSILNNKTIYPPPAVMKKIYIDSIPSRSYQRRQLRLWTKVKTGY
jgi:putrescine transport system substrate-binding protein